MMRGTVTITEPENGPRQLFRCGKLNFIKLPAFGYIACGWAHVDFVKPLKKHAGISNRFADRNITQSLMKTEQPKPATSMKPNQQPASYSVLLKHALQIFQSFAKPPCLVLAALLLYTASAPAATLIWDAGDTNLNSGTIVPGSGAWDIDTLTTLNWDTGIGTTGNTNWTQTSTTTPLNGATFTGP